MERVLTTEVHAKVGHRVRVAGWLQSWRRMGVLNFLVVRDGSGTVQAVAESADEVNS